MIIVLRPEGIVLVTPSGLSHAEYRHCTCIHGSEQETGVWVSSGRVNGSVEFEVGCFVRRESKAALRSKRLVVLKRLPLKPEGEIVPARRPQKIFLRCKCRLGLVEGMSVGPGPTDRGVIGSTEINIGKTYAGGITGEPGLGQIVALGCETRQWDPQTAHSQTGIINKMGAERVGVLHLSQRGVLEHISRLCIRRWQSRCRTHRKTSGKRVSIVAAREEPEDLLLV